jgi:hypothetical protein
MCPSCTKVLASGNVLITDPGKSTIDQTTRPITQLSPI